MVGLYAGLCRYEPSISRGARGYSPVWCIWRKGRPVLIPSQRARGTRRSGLAASTAASVRLNIRAGMWIESLFMTMPRSFGSSRINPAIGSNLVLRLSWPGRGATIEIPDRFWVRHVTVVEASRTQSRHLPLHSGRWSPVIPINGPMLGLVRVRVAGMLRSRPSMLTMPNRSTLFLGPVLCLSALHVSVPVLSCSLSETSGWKKLDACARSTRAGAAAPLVDPVRSCWR